MGSSLYLLPDAWHVTVQVKQQIANFILVLKCLNLGSYASVHSHILVTPVSTVKMAITFPSRQVDVRLVFVMEGLIYVKMELENAL